MEIRIDDTGARDKQGALITVTEPYNGEDDQRRASITLVVFDWGDGQLGVHLIGGDTDRESETLNKPTIVDGTWYGYERRFEPDADFDTATILDALNVRALDRQADEYGDVGADAAADLYRQMTGQDPDESRSKREETRT